MRYRKNIARPESLLRVVAGTAGAGGRCPGMVAPPRPAPHRPDHEQRHDLALAIDSLPPQHRDALLTCDFEERSLKEMAGRDTPSRPRGPLPDRPTCYLAMMVSSSSRVVGSAMYFL